MNQTQIHTLSNRRTWMKVLALPSFPSRTSKVIIGLSFRLCEPKQVKDVA